MQCMVEDCLARERGCLRPPDSCQRCQILCGPQARGARMRLERIWCSGRARDLAAFSRVACSILADVRRFAGLLAIGQSFLVA